MDIRVFQTADPVRYRALLDITSRATRAWCARHGMAYEAFVGLKLGSMPWHATFNRIPMLADIARAQAGGWVIYLDADAYPFELDFDMRLYLAAHRRFALIGVQCQQDQWLPNAGILLFNLDDPRSHTIIAAWQRRLETCYPGGRLPATDDWARGAQNDQSMLHDVLLKHGGLESLVRFESPRLIGDLDARVLRQVLRRFGDLAWRCAEATRGVAEALAMNGRSDRPQEGAPGQS